MNPTIKSIKDNLCHTCIFAIPQDDSSMGLVDCPKRGCGNAFSSDIHPCEHYRENQRLIALREAAVEAIREFEELNALQETDPKEYKSKYYQEKLHDAAVKSCTMSDAYALAFGLGYDDAAAILHEEARKEAKA